MRKKKLKEIPNKETIKALNEYEAMKKIPLNINVILHLLKLLKT